MYIRKMNNPILSLLILLLLFGNFSYANSTNEEQIIELYIATFNRAPDKAGLDYWLNEMNNNSWSMQMVAKSMFEQIETKTLYPDTMNITSFIDSVYLNVLNRASDSAGKEYWRKDLETKTVSKEYFIIAIINGAKDNTDASEDVKVLANKTTVGKYFAIDKNKNDIDLAKSVMTLVTSDENSIQLAKDEIDKSDTTTTCNLLAITDDSYFVDTFPSSDIEWSTAGSSVKDIEDAFNNAREKDSTITKKLVMPSQALWDSFSDQQKALFLLNKERYDRGLKPFEGIDTNVVTTAQNYAELLYTKGDFEHEADGSPWNRLDRVEIIKNNSDFFAYAENLYAAGSTASYTTEPIAKAIYGWIYADDGSAWGHREFCLAKLNDNSGEEGVEGLIGFGVKTGDNYDFYDGYKSTIVVMNAFDPSYSWDYSTTIKVSLCSDLE